MLKTTSIVFISLFLFSCATQSKNPLEKCRDSCRKEVMGCITMAEQRCEGEMDSAIEERTCHEEAEAEKARCSANRKNCRNLCTMPKS